MAMLSRPSTSVVRYVPLVLGIWILAEILAMSDLLLASTLAICAFSILSARCMDGACLLGRTGNTWHNEYLPICPEQAQIILLKGTLESLTSCSPSFLCVCYLTHVVQTQHRCGHPGHGRDLGAGDHILHPLDVDHRCLEHSVIHVGLESFSC